MFLKLGGRIRIFVFLNAIYIPFFFSFKPQTRSLPTGLQPSFTGFSSWTWDEIA